MDLNAALEYYLEARTGDLRADLIAAGQEAARRRVEGPEATVAVLVAMRTQLGMTYQEIEAATLHRPTGAKISHSTAERLCRGLA